MLFEHKFHSLSLVLALTLVLVACKKQQAPMIEPVEQNNNAAHLLRPQIPLWESEFQQSFVIRSKEEWEAAWKQTYIHRNSTQPTRTLGPDSLPENFDFSKYVILIAFHGLGRASPSTEIVGISESDNSLKVNVIHNTCLHKGLILAYEKYPADAVAILKPNKEIIFNLTNTDMCPGIKHKPNMLEGTREPNQAK